MVAETPDQRIFGPRHVAVDLPRVMDAFINKRQLGTHVTVVNFEVTVPSTATMTDSKSRSGVGGEATPLQQENFHAVRECFPLSPTLGAQVGRGGTLTLVYASATRNQFMLFAHSLQPHDRTTSR